MDDRAISLTMLAAAALAGCGGSGSGANSAPLLGTPAEVPVPVLAASLDGEPIAGEATFTFNEDGSVEIDLQDGGRIVLTQQDIDNAQTGDFIVAYNRKGSQFDAGEVAAYETAAGDRIEISLGTDLVSDDAIFAAARLDRAGNGLDGFDTYAVTGNETESADLPEGTAEYRGAFLASLMVDGQILSDAVTGTAKVTADFGTALVDVVLKGNYELADDPGESPEFRATFEGMTVTGAQYGGEMTSGRLALPEGDTVRLDGDLLGAFYGPNAEATAGVFTADPRPGKNPDADVDVAGGYWAWDTDLIDNLAP